MTFSGDLAAVPITGVCTILRQEVGVPCPCNLILKETDLNISTYVSFLPDISPSPIKAMLMLHNNSQSAALC